MNRAKYRYTTRPLTFLGTLAAHGTGMVELGRAPRQQVLIADPDVIGQIFRAERTMHMAPSRTLTPLVGERSLLYLNGERHVAYRKVVGDALRGSRLDAYRGTITQSTDTALTELMSAGQVRLPEWTRALTLRIIGQILLGTDDRVLLEPFAHWVESVLGARHRTLAYRYLRPSHAVPSPWRTFLRRRAAIGRTLLDAARATRPADQFRPLAVDLLSGAHPLGAVDDDELLDQIISLLFAGHETTASAIAWTLYWLERNPAVRHDLRAEVTAADGTRADDSPLLDAVCKEALRLSPPAMVAGHRVLREDRELAGRSFAAGTRLTPSIYLVHHRPDVFERPGHFDPGRFLGVRRPASEYLPFGGGMRRCLGADLATLEMRMVVAAVLRQTDLFCLNPGAGVPHLRGPAMGPGPRLTMRACPVR